MSSCISRTFSCDQKLLVKGNVAAAPLFRPPICRVAQTPLSRHTTGRRFDSHASVELQNSFLDDSSLVRAKNHFLAASVMRQAIPIRTYQSNSSSQYFFASVIHLWLTPNRLSSCKLSYMGEVILDSFKSALNSDNFASGTEIRKGEGCFVAWAGIWEYGIAIEIFN
jgi:hypothetical protein